MLSVKYHLGCDPASGDDESEDLNVVLAESADQLRPSWLRPARGDALQDEDPRTVPAWRSNPRTTVVKWTPSSPPRLRQPVTLIQTLSCGLGWRNQARGVIKKRVLVVFQSICVKNIGGP